MKLLDAAISAHKRLLNDASFFNIMQAWESKAPSIQIMAGDGKCDLTTSALTGARAEGYRLAMKHFIELSNTK